MMQAAAHADAGAPEAGAGPIAFIPFTSGSHFPMPHTSAADGLLSGQIA